MQSGFFLGANSRYGFYSRYHELIDLTQAEQVYIIKGSPGGGKSTFMRRVAENLDTYASKIYCSSDPDSLDAVIFPTLGVALVDGTAPHVVEPTFPLAAESYINLGEFADPVKIKARKESLISAATRYRGQFDRAYRLTSCAGTLREDARTLAEGGVDLSRLIKKSKGIVSRELRPTGHTGKIHGRFLSAISPKGHVTLYDTVIDLADRVFLLDDTYGIGAHLLSVLAKEAEALGHTVFACYSPLCPEHLEHLLLPDAHLAFVTVNKYHPYPFEPSKHMRIDAMLDRDYLRSNRGKLRFSNALSEELVDAACKELAAAKRVHDELEGLYHPCINFDALLTAADKLAKRITT